MLSEMWMLEMVGVKVVLLWVLMRMVHVLEICLLPEVWITQIDVVVRIVCVHAILGEFHGKAVVLALVVYPLLAGSDILWAAHCL